jgi:ABC-type multidrug transport system fused ATPase/permease subunit
MIQQVSEKQARLAHLQRHVKRLEKRREKLNAQYRSLWAQQLAGFVASVVFCILAFATFAPLGLLIILAEIGYFIYNRRKQKNLRLRVSAYTSLIEVKLQHLARLELDWEHIPAIDDGEREVDHPFEHDLDITGEYSLLELMNTGRTEEGQARLRSWLLNRIPDRETIAARQKCVREIAPLSDFRDRLQALSHRLTGDVEFSWDESVVRLWLQRPRLPRPSFLLVALSWCLSGLLAIVLLLYLFTHIPFSILALAVAATFTWSIWTMKYRSHLFDDPSQMQNAFEQLKTVFTFLETYHYGKHQQLRNLCEPFFARKPKPSRLLKNLKEIAKRTTSTQKREERQASSAGTAQLQQQLIPFLFNQLVPWDLTLAYRLGHCEEQAKAVFPLWLDRWYELEALCSLATFAYLNPDYILPKFGDQAEKEPVFQAIGLGHPLLSDSGKVTNDLTIERRGDLLLITGSNMAGKSTFLRALGINLCLAYAGAPVNAQSMCTDLFEIYCCIRVTDSLVDGYSYFYAEVRRLKQLLQRVQEETPHPVFFLIDEIFKGTNNRERLIGSRAYISTLAEAQCNGVVSTHDLELIDITEDLPQIKNYHFRDDIVNGHMAFDYHLYPGPCSTTNALKIMEMEGLPTIWKRALH